MQITSILLMLLQLQSIVSTKQLILTKYIKTGNIKEAQHAAKVSHPSFASFKSFSGYLTVNETTNSQMFFWFIRSAKQGNVPMVLWLQGGPGLSSLYGLFMEIGPLQSSTPEVTELRKTSWHKSFNMLFLDNPVGVGFSTTHPDGFVNNQEEVGRDMYTAIVQFVQLFPDMAIVDLYIAGESFGAKFMIALAHSIHLKNKINCKLNLKGLIGVSGVYDLNKQINYAEFFYQHGLIDDNQKDSLVLQQNAFLRHVEDQQYLKAFKIFSDIVNNAPELTIDGTFYNNFTGMYNTLSYLTTRQNLSTYRNAAMFLQRKDVKRALHVGTTTFQDFINTARERLLIDVPKSITPWVLESLSHYRFLSLSGSLDVVIPFTFLDNYWLSLESIAEGYKNTKKTLLYLDNELIGFAKSSGNLTQVVIRDAGHSVPTDQPEASYYVVSQFINGNNFD